MTAWQSFFRKVCRAAQVSIGPKFLACAKLLDVLPDISIVRTRSTEEFLRLRLITLLALVFIVICVNAFASQDPTQTQRQGGFSQASPTPTPTPLPPPTVKIDGYRAAAARIIGAALTSDRAYSRLAHLTDHIGHRLSGSKNLERAIEWAVAEMKRDGLDNVRTEKVMVPHWVRGEESLEMVTPVPRKLTMLGLGNSVGTPAEGITAEAVVVRNFAELDRLGEGVRGKIVVYNAPFTNLRSNRCLSWARCFTRGSLRRGCSARALDHASEFETPHTGAMQYDPAQPQIPVAAITIEAAELLQRMHDRGDRPTAATQDGSEVFA